MNINIEQLARVLRAVETLDKAAQSWGWMQDQGSERQAFRAKRLWKAAKTRLLNMLKDIEASDSQAALPGAVPGLNDLLTHEEREALRKETKNDE
jgi:hypothetical protein